MSVSPSNTTVEPPAGAETDLDFERLVTWLEATAADNSRLATMDKTTRERLLRACGRLALPGNEAKRRLDRARRKARKRERRARHEATLATTGIRAQMTRPVFPTPGPVPALPASSLHRKLSTPRTCYMCKVEYTELHSFYDALCPSCAALNWHKRHQSADLSGRVALVTGARVKIGHQAGISG